MSVLRLLTFKEEFSNTFQASYLQNGKIMFLELSVGSPTHGFGWFWTLSLQLVLRKFTGNSSTIIEIYVRI